MDLSIIVPVYQVEKYIRTCVESIFRQGLDDARFEVIIINDGTKDKSMEMIADIISRHDNITVIHQENQGLSVARNTGIAAAKGEYILMPDSDDLLIENSLSPLLEKGLESKADIVVANFLVMSNEEIEQFEGVDQNNTEYKEKDGEQLFLEDLNPYRCYVWCSLYRREFLLNNHLSFVPGIYIQDVPFTHECYLKAKKCIRTTRLLNIYRKGHDSATFSFNKKKAKDFCTAIAKTWELTHLPGLQDKIQEKLRADIYESFLMMIWITTHKLKKTSDRTEMVDFMRQQAPDLHFRNGIKQKVISFMFRHLPHTFIRLCRLHDIIENHIRPFYSQRLRRSYSR